MTWSMNWLKLALFWSLPFVVGLLLSVFAAFSILLDQANEQAVQSVRVLAERVQAQHRLVHEDALLLARSNAVQVTLRLRLRPQLRKILHERLRLFGSMEGTPLAVAVYLKGRPGAWLALSTFEDLSSRQLDRLCRTKQELQMSPPHQFEVVRQPVSYQSQSVGRLCVVGALNHHSDRLNGRVLDGRPLIRLNDEQVWRDFFTLDRVDLSGGHVYAHEVGLEEDQRLQVGLLMPSLPEMALAQLRGDTRVWQWALVALPLLFFAYLGMQIWWMRTLKKEAGTRLALFSELQEGVALVDAEGHIQEANARMQVLLAQAASREDKQDFIRLFQLEDSDETLEALIQAVVKEGVNWHSDGLVRMRFPDGSLHWAELSLAPIPDSNSALVVLEVKDEQQRMIEELRWQATHDEPTGVFNIRGFLSAGRRLLARRKNGATSLVIVELMHLRALNESIGRESVDRLLRQVARLMRTLGREHCGRAVVGRHSSSEFYMLVPCDADATAELAERLLEELSALKGEGRGKKVTPKVLVGHMSVRPQETLEQAAGRGSLLIKSLLDSNRSGIADLDRDDVRVEAPGLIPLLQWALEEDRFELYGQRIEPLKSGLGPARYEVLLRLKDQEGRFVSPGDFIPAAERYGLAQDIDLWVVENLFRQYGDIYREWAEQGRSIYPFSINLSGATLGDAASARRLLALAEKYDISPALLAFEVTETAAIERIEVARDVLGELASAGCTILLDDFGTGQSSLQYLRTLPVQVIKIDGTFVRHLLDSPVDQAVVEASILLAQRMGCKSVAEFVEDEAHCERLRELGADLVQGYGIEPPRPLAELFPASEERS